MAKEFKTLTAFAKHMTKVMEKYPRKEMQAAEFLGKVLEAEAKDKIGHLQEGGGPFSEWKELAEATKTDKERLGFVYNHEYNPLYRTGDLKKSIHHVFNPASHNLYLGSDSEIMIYQELGTVRGIPPRSVLGLTMYQAKADINYIMGNMLVSWIADKPISKRKKTYGSV